jgi:2-polyprenyl-6-methoxyphenol hydroxylase-like FAD-dependent oxidoreductase
MKLDRVLIIGAGIGGLALQRALRERGVACEVLERAGSLDAAGAGIALARNAMLAAEAIGVGDAIRERGAAARTSAILDARGRALAAVPTEPLAGAVALHRADLQQALRTGDERLASEARAVDVDGSVELADGSVERADLVVGADGLRSIARRCVAPGGRIRYSGYAAWRAVADWRCEPGRWQESWGRGGRFGILDIGADRSYWFATKNVEEGGSDGGRDEVLERFGAWHSPIRALVEATPPAAVFRTDVLYLEPLPSWSRGKVILLGDAAHAMTPGTGQGAAQALEDAVVLARALARASDLAAAAAEYESLRRPRVKRIAQLSRRLDLAGQASSPIATAVRDLAIRLTPSAVRRRQARAITEAPAVLAEDVATGAG